MAAARRVVGALTLALVALLAGAPAGRSAAADPDPVGSWQWPLQPQPAVLRPFVPPAAPYGPGHRGVDLAGTVGQPVLAVGAGRVSFAGQVAGRGVVVVHHGQLRTTYEPVLVLVRHGQRTSPGEVVGTLELAGGHCLPVACLHLGARDRTGYVDPLRWLGGGRVRLLPLDGSPPVPACCPAAVGGSPPAPPPTPLPGLLAAARPGLAVMLA